MFPTGAIRRVERLTDLDPVIRSRMALPVTPS